MARPIRVSEGREDGAGARDTSDVHVALPEGGQRAVILVRPSVERQPHRSAARTRPLLTQGCRQQTRTCLLFHWQRIIETPTPPPPPHPHPLHSSTKLGPCLKTWFKTKNVIIESMVLK